LAFRSAMQRSGLLRPPLDRFFVIPTQELFFSPRCRRCLFSRSCNSRPLTLLFRQYGKVSSAGSPGIVLAGIAFPLPRTPDNHLTGGGSLSWYPFFTRCVDLRQAGSPIRTQVTRGNNTLLASSQAPSLFEIREDTGHQHPGAVPYGTQRQQVEVFGV